ncbi:TetR/AcrR family transcriptional regulator [Limnobacter sp.]|uniref:TetR/AcrR family transcriptional regulator n=1 Tax=Limnobacter sp. TaxID=2003368 RepID=UPI00351557C6
MSQTNTDKKTRGKAEVRRQQILDAAAQCFRKSGFHGASMADIAKSFGMSAGHIYNYFESKEAIIEAMVQRDLSDTLARIAAIREKGDILNAMLGAVDDGVQRRIAQSQLDAEIVAEASRNPKVAQVVQQTDAVIRQEVARLIESVQPAMASQCPHMLAAKTTILMALFEGLMIRAIRNPNMQQAELGIALKKVIEQMLQS